MSMTATASQPMMKGTSDRSSALAWNHRALGKPVAVSLLLHATVFASLFAWWHAQGAPAPRGLPDGFSVTLIELSDPSPAPAAPVEPQPQIESEPIAAPAIPVKPEVALDARPEPRPEARAALVKPAAPQQTASLAPTLATGAGQGAPKGLEKTNGQQADEILVLNPRYRDRPRPPRYPDRARSLNQEGIVKVRIKLDRRGDPMDVAVLASSGYALLDHAALMAARKWRFEPEIRNGRPVIAFVEMPVEFVLTGSR
ncbi:MAG: hypothetical protein AMXMBFR74_10230 [Parvibaculum sp.]|uniref:energy transducer TonB n=1 Tax=Parvibaculum sp. TaxID=2024848 RepID=UPI0035B7EFF8